MACPSYGSSSLVSLYYCEDADPSASLPTTLTWNQIRMTGETIDLALTSTISDEITPQRSFSNSKLSQGEVTGAFNYEVQSPFIDDFLICVLQNEIALGGTWATDALKNQSDVKCLAIMKRVQHANGDLDIYCVRGVQINSMTMEFQPSALITGSCNIMGVGADDVRTADEASWTLVSAPASNLMSAVDSLKDLQVQNDAGVDQGLIFQSMTLTLDNQMRQQYGVGTNNIFASGLASGRFMASLSASAYYSDPTIYDAFRNDSDLKVAFSLEDSDGEGWDVLFDKVKITSGSTPQAGAPDQDLLIATEMRAFESASNGTVMITKL